MSDETRQRISESVRRRFAVKLEERIEEIVQAEGISKLESVNLPYQLVTKSRLRRLPGSSLI